MVRVKRDGAIRVSWPKKFLGIATDGTEKLVNCKQNR